MGRFGQIGRFRRNDQFPKIPPFRLDFDGRGNLNLSFNRWSRRRLPFLLASLYLFGARLRLKQPAHGKLVVFLVVFVPVRVRTELPSARELSEQWQVLAAVQAAHIPVIGSLVRIVEGLRTFILSFGSEPFKI